MAKRIYKQNNQLKNKCNNVWQKHTYGTEEQNTQTSRIQFSDYTRKVTRLRGRVVHIIVNIFPIVQRVLILRPTQISSICQKII